MVEHPDNFKTLSYFVILQHQTLTNLGLTLTMLIVVVIMVYRKMIVSVEFSKVI